MATCEFVRKKENVAFIGPPGTGKTHLGIALGVKSYISRIQCIIYNNKPYA
ncbi:ATP-binding protein [Acetivibrio clariflavus]|uniref:ATP-binding protein n=1 Tax=Acetivibrio clariflavus TaxID=288965 RepID=UPI0004ADAFFE